MAGGAIATFLKDVAGGFFGNDYLRDYTHASKTFRSSLYRYAPKYKFLFHVYFDVNLGADVSNEFKQKNFGLLVKSIKLPTFNFDTHTLNQYNRKRIVQTRIKYDPITITFHDDNTNLINGLWYAYYTYYYKDATKPNVVFSGTRGTSTGTDTATNYNERNIYNNLNSGTDNWDWGYIGDTSTPSAPSGVKTPFFNKITVYGFNQHNFTAYTLINPIITSFGHDTYAYSENSGVMENTMTISYETVVYNQGAIDGTKPDNIVTGFGSVANYDRRTSPIAIPGSNSNILGQGGIVDGVGGFVQSLGQDNVLQAAKIAGTTYNSLKNVGLSTITAEVKQNIQNALQDTSNDTRQKLFDIPVYGQTPALPTAAGTPSGSTQMPNITSIENAGKQITGAISSISNTISNSFNKLF